MAPAVVPSRAQIDFTPYEFQSRIQELVSWCRGEQAREIDKIAIPLLVAAVAAVAIAILFENPFFILIGFGCALFSWMVHLFSSRQYTMIATELEALKGFRSYCFQRSILPVRDNLISLYDQYRSEQLRA